MESHFQLQKRGYSVRSFGTGTNVRLPGPSQDRPNVYEFGTPYADIRKDLTEKAPPCPSSPPNPAQRVSPAATSASGPAQARALTGGAAQDEKLYTSNGLLGMLNRNVKVKLAPERWHDMDKAVPFDVVLTYEERVFDAVVQELQGRGTAAPPRASSPRFSAPCIKEARNPSEGAGAPWGGRESEVLTRGAGGSVGAVPGGARDQHRDARQPRGVGHLGRAHVRPLRPDRGRSLPPSALSPQKCVCGAVCGCRAPERCARSARTSSRVHMSPFGRIKDISKRFVKSPGRRAGADARRAAQAAGDIEAELAGLIGAFHDRTQRAVLYSLVYV